MAIVQSFKSDASGETVEEHDLVTVTVQMDGAESKTFHVSDSEWSDMMMESESLGQMVLAD